MDCTVTKLVQTFMCLMSNLMGVLNCQMHVFIKMLIEPCSVLNPDLQ